MDVISEKGCGIKYDDSPVIYVVLDPRYDWSYNAYAYLSSQYV